MSAVLTIDQGNTHVKYTLFDAEGGLLRSALSVEPDLEVADGLLCDVELEGGIYASVGHFDVRFAESLRVLCADRLMVFTSSTPIPLKNNYKTPATLGADRIAAAVGAITLYPGLPVLIADAGSALTLDLIAPEAVYCGGTISPGVNMRLKALHRFTSRLPQVNWLAETKITPFPLTTAEALLSGAVLGVVDQIKAALISARNLFPHTRLLLTGGDAENLMSASLLNDLSPLCHPELVAIGLNRIYHYNETLA